MTTEQKNNALGVLAELLKENEGEILKENEKDIAAHPQLDDALLDRLRLTPKKIAGMIAKVYEVAARKDPEGQLIYSHIRGDGLRIENRTVPFGKIFIIYESRPDVTIEASAIAFKAGNSIFLKGGKEAKNTNLFLVELWREALAANGLPGTLVSYLDITREETQALIADGTEGIDLIIPRGGEALITFVRDHSAVPVLVSGRGNNFLYIAPDADIAMAEKIILNGKQKLSVCNALDKVLIDKSLPELASCVERLTGTLESHALEVYGDADLCALDSRIRPMTEGMIDEEFLSAKIALMLAHGLNEAIDAVNEHSGGHSAAIVTQDAAAAQEFMERVDCGAVYHNASTRFTDGGQFGLGAEIAISTQKLHFRGPLGADELVTNKWFIYGNGHVRE